MQGTINIYNNKIYIIVMGRYSFSPFSPPFPLCVCVSLCACVSACVCVCVCM